MDSEKLYRVQEEDLSKLEELLCRSFAADPLYVELIPDEEVRKRLMPELFQCDLTEFYETCEIFADSKDLNGILVVSDETEPYHLLHRYFTEVQATLRTEGYLIREDHSLKTFFNFVLGRDYLNSSWTDQLHQDRRLHIIYLAVDPEMQHHGIAATLVEEAVAYAERNDLMISLETHNPRNVAFYQQFGFKVYGVVEKHFSLKQYCLVREIQAYYSNSSPRHFIRKSASSMLSAASQLLLLMKRRSLRSFLGADFPASAKSAPRKLRVNCSTIFGSA